MNLDSKTMADAVAKLPPPWNTEVVSCTWDAQMNNDLVEYFDHKPIPPSRWEEGWEYEDEFGVYEASRRKTLAEFKFEVARYRIALAEWEQRRAEGKPIQMRGFVSSGPPTITVKVTRKDGSRATIVGDGEAWKVTEVWYGK